jgi:hypothetical protein
MNDEVNSRSSSQGLSNVRQIVRNRKSPRLQNSQPTSKLCRAYACSQVVEIIMPSPSPTILINPTMTAMNNTSPALQPRRVRSKTPSSLAGMLDDPSSSDLCSIAAKPVEVRHHHRSKPHSTMKEELRLLSLNLRRTKRRLLLAAVAQSSHSSKHGLDKSTEESTENDESESSHTRSEAISAS